MKKIQLRMKRLLLPWFLVISMMMSNMAYGAVPEEGGLSAETVEGTLSNGEELSQDTEVEDESFLLENGIDTDIGSEESDDAPGFEEEDSGDPSETGDIDETLVSDTLPDSNGEDGNAGGDITPGGTEADSVTDEVEERTDDASETDGTETEVAGENTEPGKDFLTEDPLPSEGDESKEADYGESTGDTVTDFGHEEVIVPESEGEDIAAESAEEAEITEIKEHVISPEAADETEIAEPEQDVAIAEALDETKIVVPEDEMTVPAESLEDVVSNLLLAVEVPAMTSAEPVQNGVELHWQASGDASFYNVYRRAKGKGFWSEVGSHLTVCEYVDTTAESGKEYDYSAVACNSGGTEITAIGQKAVSISYLAPPSLITGEQKGVGIEVGWTPVTGARKYVLMRKITDSSDDFVPVVTLDGETTYWDCTVEDYTDYSYTVIARADGFADSAYDPVGTSVWMGSKVCVWIMTQPVDKTVAEGGNTEFFIFADGAGVSYKWQYKDAGSDTWKDLKTTSEILKVNNAPLSINGRQYRCFASSLGYTQESDVVTLKVVRPTKILTQPKDTAVTPGGTVKISVTASGDSLSYKWQYKEAGSDVWKDLKTKSATVTVANVPASINGRKYHCIVSGTFGTITSNDATLTVASKPVITTQPKSTTVGVGSTTKFTVVATGSSLTYTWQYKNAGASSWGTLKTTTPTLTVSKVPSSINGRQYRCIVKSGSSSVTSSVATLTVVAATKIVTQPKSQTVKAGGTAVFSVSASGKNLKYQWQYANSGSTKWTNLKTTTPKLTVGKVPSSINNRRYRCIVTGDGGAVTSSVVQLHVN